MVPARVVMAFVIGAFVGLGWYLWERPRVTVVAFVELPFERGPEGWDFEVFAPDGFPDCTLELLDIRIEDRAHWVSETFRPKPGVQCGLPVELESWWVDATGKRLDRPPPENRLEGRLLLMGKAGASDSGGIETACGMKPPITYFVELAGEPFEVGSMEKPDCYDNRTRLYSSILLYRGGGLETPAGWLDPAIAVPTEVRGDEIPFVLTMTNDTDDDIIIGRCPFIDVRFVTQPSEESDRTTGYRTFLNCPAAPDRIESGDVVVFEVVMPLANEQGSGRLQLELRDENRVIHRISSDDIEITR